MDRITNVALPADPAALAAAVPDLPRWVYARSLLLSGAAVVRLGADGDAALVTDSTTAVLIGRPDRKLLAALAGDQTRRSLLIQQDVAEAACAVLPAWIARPFVVHALPHLVRANTPPVAGVVVSAPLNPALLIGLPDDVRDDAGGAPAAAVRIVDQMPVAMHSVRPDREILGRRH